MEKGLKGLVIFHESDYFKQKLYFHKVSIEAEKWVKAIAEQAQFFDINEKYERA
jgi:serine/threonine protein kinase